jgi:hypothetical protein
VIVVGDTEFLASRVDGRQARSVAPSDPEQWWLILRRLPTSLICISSEGGLHAAELPTKTARPSPVTESCASPELQLIQGLLLTGKLSPLPEAFTVAQFK